MKVTHCDLCGEPFDAPPAGLAFVSRGVLSSSRATRSSVEVKVQVQVARNSDGSALDFCHECRASIIDEAFGSRAARPA